MKYIARITVKQDGKDMGFSEQVIHADSTKELNQRVSNIIADYNEMALLMNGKTSWTYELLDVREHVSFA